MNNRTSQTQTLPSISLQDTVLSIKSKHSALLNRLNGMQRAPDASTPKGLATTPPIVEKTVLDHEQDFDDACAKLLKKVTTVKG